MAFEVMKLLPARSLQAEHVDGEVFEGLCQRRTAWVRPQRWNTIFLPWSCGLSHEQKPNSMHFWGFQITMFGYTLR